MSKGIRGLDATHLFDELGARRAAELNRHNHYSTYDQDVVLAALAELRPEKFMEFISRMDTPSIALMALERIWYAFDEGKTQEARISKVAQMFGVEVLRGLKTRSWRSFRVGVESVAEWAHPYRREERGYATVRNVYSAADANGLVEMITAGRDFETMRQLLRVGKSRLTYEQGSRIRARLVVNGVRRVKARRAQRTAEVAQAT